MNSYTDLLIKEIDELRSAFSCEVGIKLKYKAERDEARKLAKDYRDAWRAAEHVHPYSADWGMDILPWEVEK